MLDLIRTQVKKRIIFYKNRYYGVHLDVSVNPWGGLGSWGKNSTYGGVMGDTTMRVVEWDFRKNLLGSIPCPCCKTLYNYETVAELEIHLFSGHLEIVDMASPNSKYSYMLFLDEGNGEFNAVILYKRTKYRVLMCRIECMDYKILKEYLSTTEDFWRYRPRGRGKMVELKESEMEKPKEEVIEKEKKNKKFGLLEWN